MDDGYRAIAKDEPDWSKSPDYITHYDPEFGSFVFKTGGAFFHYDSKQDSLLKLTVDHAYTDKLIPRDSIVEHALDATSPSNAFDLLKPNCGHNGQLLQFIADRMQLVYKENPNVDYMIALRSLVADQFDATANTKDEWPSETEKAAMDAATFGTGFMIDGKRVDPKDVFIDVPETVEWDGKGLPPAGVECEVGFNVRCLCDDTGGELTVPEGTRVEINGHADFGNGVTAVYSGRVESKWFYTIGGAHTFRPILTPEQAEERERENFIIDA